MTKILSEHKNISILEVAEHEMVRAQKAQPFRPEEVIKWIFPQAWKYFIPDVLVVIDRLHREGAILVIHNDCIPELSLKNEMRF